MRIRALNEPDNTNSTSLESTNDDEPQVVPSKEASEEQLFDKYKEALTLLQLKKNDSARNVLKSLVKDLENPSGDALIQLKFSALKNLAHVQGDSVECYIKALEIDSSDICLWLKTGERAKEMDNFAFARSCFEQAVSLNPNNWVAIDKLMELYYVLHLPLELYDICTRALSLNSSHKKAKVLLMEAIEMQPTLKHKLTIQDEKLARAIIAPLAEAKKRRRDQMREELGKLKKARLSISLDTARTQSVSSLGTYLIKIYERFAKHGLTRNTMIDINFNSSFSFSHQLNNASINSLSNNQNSNEIQNSSSQDVEMAIEADGSQSDTERSNNRNERTTSNDDNDPSKSGSRGPNVSQQRSSSLSFAAMLFPMDMGDKRRSSRNKSNQDDTFSFKMKFDELNELLPECLRIGAIEQALQRRREKQQKESDDENKEKEEPIVVENSLEPVRDDLIIKEIMAAISDATVPAGFSARHDIRLCELFYLYLSKLSLKKQNNLPETYCKIYRMYRKLCPLPTDAFIDIGPEGITIEELWFTLTANEIVYQSTECFFLLRIIEQLEMHFENSQHREFVVRLFLVLGLNSDHRYLDMALQQMGEDTKVHASNRKIITRAYIKTLIDKTNEKLQQESEDLDQSIELISKLENKSENEMSDREISSLCAAIKSTQQWQRGLDILNQRNDLNSDIIIETINECLKNGAQMDAILSSKLCKDAILGARAATWTCLYRGWLSCLSLTEYESEANLEALDKFFELGHQTLGKKNCCTLDKGEYLMLYVKHMLDQGDNFEERELFGALNCLFGYPSKKPASVVGHKAVKVQMTWDYATIIYPYLVPERLPTYLDLLRKVGISSELEGIFRDIVAATPDELSPNEGAKAIEEYIENGTRLSPILIKQNEVTENIYYLLADYYFKNKDFSTAKDFYHLDLAINVERFDSWAASALIRANGADKALSDGSVSTEEFVDGSFKSLTDSAIRCFQRGTTLRPDEPRATLWIEYGNLAYNLTALGARIYTYDDFQAQIEGSQPIDKTKLLKRHRYVYNLSKKAFESANKLCQSDEIWLHYYMLGKIHEKTNTFTALDFYQTADGQLYHEGASYPKKISYHNPPDLAYEAMEIHYRIHSCVMKFLLGTQDISQEQMNRLKRYLLNAQRSPFVTLEGHPEPKSGMSERLDSDVSLLLMDTVDNVCEEAGFDELIFMCLHGFKRCLVRCDKNFKALYRLAYYYQKIRDFKMARDILLARELETDQRISNFLTKHPGKSEFRVAPPDLRGVDSLFRDRKIGNLFFNIWRIPVEEVDRPGSFEHWMFKCTWLLINLCVRLQDEVTMSTIAAQLSRQPETSKRFLHDRSRVLLVAHINKKLNQLALKAQRQRQGQM